jgi:hypothetical protein
MSNPAQRVVPSNPTLRFLTYFLDDFNDEWLYRPAVGSRWSYQDNVRTAGWQIAEEMSIAGGSSAAELRESIAATMTSSMTRLGVTPVNIDAWMQNVLVGWLEVLQRHLSSHDYIFGARPSLADFALFGGNAAHFVGDHIAERSSRSMRQPLLITRIDCSSLGVSNPARGSLRSTCPTR